MAGVAGGIVLDFEARRRKSRLQLCADRRSDGLFRHFDHGFLDGAPIRGILRIMSGAFQYRPRFVDIRVRPPTPEEEAAEADVLRLKPGEKRCDWPGCARAGENRAPKSRERLNDHYAFCQAHAAEYNRNWNFFAGMSEAEAQRVREEQVTGGRPTWQFKASNMSREAAAFAAKLGGKARGSWRDAFDLFGGGRAQRPEPEGPRLGKLERQALADLDLEDGADKAAIRARYKELVKRCHPDANGGDRSAEHKLQRVLKAYQTLRKAGVV